MKEFLDINNIALDFEIYKLSYLEAIATLFGLLSVWLASKSNKHTWTTGLISVICFFYLFYQINLYSDMFLQVFFAVTSVIGWFKWREKKNFKISKLQLTKFTSLIVLTTVLSFGLSWYVKTLHVNHADLFPIAASYPLADSFTTVLSICATMLLIMKKIEAWILWIIVDIVSVWIYFNKGVWFVSFEYLIFLCMAFYGFVNWRYLKGSVNEYN